MSRNDKFYFCQNWYRFTSRGEVCCLLVITSANAGIMWSVRLVCQSFCLSAVCHSASQPASHCPCARFSRTRLRLFALSEHATTTTITTVVFCQTLRQYLNKTERCQYSLRTSSCRCRASSVLAMRGANRSSYDSRSCWQMPVITICFCSRRGCWLHGNHSRAAIRSL